MTDARNDRALARWRLVLGRFAEERMPCPSGEVRKDRVLDYLYGREYERRGIRTTNASSGPSLLSVPEWIREVRELFPSDTCEIITRHALNRYGMTELVTNPETLAKLEPNYELLKVLLTFKGMMKGEVLELARQIIRQVVEELRRELESEVRPALSGPLDRMRRTRFKNARNLDLQRTVRSNLRHWNVERRQLLVHDLYFRARVKRHLPWHIIIAIDCSGSMADSVIHSAVMAGIFKALPAVQVSLLAFDTAVVDLSDAAHDPVEILMSVQLGGGTDIGRALATCARLVVHPTRTLVVLVTDFCEGGPATSMLTTIRRLRGEGVRVLGLAALDREATPVYDRQIAAACADAGAEIAAMTPKHLAAWVGRILS